MAFNQASSRQIKAGAIDNTHIKIGAGIDESKLNIDWATHAANTLASRLLVDFVQVTGKSVPSAASSIFVTDKISALPAATETEKGAIVEAGKNKVILRNSVSGDPVVSQDGTEVYGKLTRSAENYVLNFFYRDATNGELPFTFESAATIDFQFPQRFDLNTISETFAANEKFVDGASDVSSRLDLTQIAKDTFGDTYTLEQDGEANRPISIVAEIARETTGVANSNEHAKDIIDEFVDARGGYDALADRLLDSEERISENTSGLLLAQSEITNARGEGANLNERLDGIDASIGQEVSNREDAIALVRSDLASTEELKGAALIGFKDDALAAITVEEAILEVEDRLATVEQSGGVEVVASRSSALTGEHDTLDERLEAGEARFENVKTEVTNARTSTAKGSLDVDGETVIDKVFSSVDNRIEEVEEDHKAEVARATAAEDKLTADLATEVTRATSAEGVLQTNITTVSTDLSEYETSNDDRVALVEGKNTAQDTSIANLDAASHRHFSEDKQVLTGDALINTSRYDLQTGTFVFGNKTLDVYINGFLQMNGVHYTEIKNLSNEGIAVSFNPEVISANDVIQFRWVK